MPERSKSKQAGEERTAQEPDSSEAQRHSYGRAEAHYQRMFDNIPVGLYRTTLDGRIIDANAALVQMLLYPSRDALLKTNAIELYAHPEDRARAARMLEQDGVLRGLEIQLVRHDGTLIWARDNARKVRNADGKVTYFEDSLEDISERKRVTEQLQRSVAQLRRAMEGTIEAMALTAEMRDPHTAGHQRRVARLAAAIATELGLDRERVQGIRLAALIHDIGKIYVPAELLSKPGRLSEIEFALIRVHPEVGYEILKTVKFPWPIATTVVQHHEKLDGSGYPHGLQGDAIILEARIVGVADVVEAMASHRPYRPALGVRRALDEISEHRGTRFDGEVVDACMALFLSERFEFE